MKTYIKICSTLFLFIVVLSSCRTIVDDIKLGQTNDEAMLFGFLNPKSDTITIALSIAKGISKNKEKSIQYQDIENAVVYIEGNATKVKMDYLQSFPQERALFYCLKSEMEISSGNTYTITASNGNLFSLSATTTVPDDNFDFSFETDGPYFPPGLGSGIFYNLQLLINENAGGENFYRIESKYRNYPDSAYIYVNGYFNNALSNNNVLEYRTKAYINYWMPTIKENTTLMILKISESYYRYNEYTNKGYEEGNPFAEPSTMYTNVKGGYGILGSFVMKEKPM